MIRSATWTCMIVLLLAGSGCIASEAVLDGVFVGISGTIATLLQEALLASLQTPS